MHVISSIEWPSMIVTELIKEAFANFLPRLTIEVRQQLEISPFYAPEFTERVKKHPEL